MSGVWGAPRGYDDEHEPEREPPVCPYCGRVMSNREAAEQGACNECYDANVAYGRSHEDWEHRP